MSEPATLLASLQQRLDDALRPLVTPATAIALVDFPDFANVGDSAIWLGALATLHRLGAPPPCYTCDVRTYDRRLLERRLGAGTILLNGGGSLGDLWGRHQAFRERIMVDFPDNPIVQLPQSLHFGEQQGLARARAVFDRHSRLTLLLRDHESLALAREHFHAAARLAPDLAFGLAPLRSTVRPTHDVLWLKRGDLEDRWGDATLPPDSRREDWVDEERTRLIRWHDDLARAYDPSARTSGARRWMLSRLYPHLAGQRLRRGLRLLGSARVVVTDRLHGHILCMLSGTPHVVLDNSYRKLGRFVETWTGQSTLVRMAGSPAAAASEAVALLSVTRSTSAPR